MSEAAKKMASSLASRHMEVSWDGSKVICVDDDNLEAICALALAVKEYGEYECPDDCDGYCENVAVYWEKVQAAIDTCIRLGILPK